MVAGGSHTPPSDYRSTPYPLLSIGPQCGMESPSTCIISPCISLQPGSLYPTSKASTSSLSLFISFLPHPPAQLYFETVDHLNSQPQSSEPKV